MAYGVTPAPATNAVNVTVPIDRAAVIVGAPKLSLTYTGTAPSGDKPTPFGLWMGKIISLTIEPSHFA